MAGHPIVAALYDRVLEPVEHAGLGNRRTEILSFAHGRVLEIAAGNGHNLGHYPSAVSSLTLLEPDPHMFSRLVERVESRPVSESWGLGRQPVTVQASAESLPFEAESFDSVVCTLGLCTIPDPAAALSEALRVLVPGGVFCFVEHVRAADSGSARVQDLITPVWRRVAGGCHPNRDSASSIEAAGFQMAECERARMPKAPKPLRPMISGYAKKPA